MFQAERQLLVQEMPLHGIAADVATTNVAWMGSLILPLLLLLLLHAGKAQSTSPPEDQWVVDHHWQLNVTKVARAHVVAEATRGAPAQRNPDDTAAALGMKFCCLPERCCCCCCCCSTNCCCTDCKNLNGSQICGPHGLGPISVSGPARRRPIAVQHNQVA
jgi:hypothetical protein